VINAQEVKNSGGVHI